MRIAVAADHNGVHLKRTIVVWLKAHGHVVDDHGGFTDEVVDYPPLCSAVCKDVVSGRADRGVVIGGSGMGEVIACNKVRGIRAGLCHDPFTTGISRTNNDGNVMVMGAKVVTPELAMHLIEKWTTTDFAGGQHRERLDQIAELEAGNWL